MFDSCLHVKNNSLNHLLLISKKLRKNKLNKALCMFDNEKKFIDRKIFLKNCNKTKNLIPVATIRNTKNLKSEIRNIKELGFKFVKFHPRNLNIKIGSSFYIKAFKYIRETKLNIMWCTFDGWSTKKMSEINQLDFLTKLINIITPNNILLMHGGGPNLLKYYEKFRFQENVYLDLSYTLIHYQKSSLENDMIFLMNKFDKRLIFGSDFPLFSFNKFKKSLDKLIKKSKVNKLKVKNLKKNNFMRLLND